MRLRFEISPCVRLSEMKETFASPVRDPPSKIIYTHGPLVVFVVQFETIEDHPENLVV
jgi:hypothetical protein